LLPCRLTDCRANLISFSHPIEQLAVVVVSVSVSVSSTVGLLAFRRRNMGWPAGELEETSSGRRFVFALPAGDSLGAAGRRHQSILVLVAQLNTSSQAKPLTASASLRLQAREFSEPDGVVALTIKRWRRSREASAA